MRGGANAAHLFKSPVTKSGTPGRTNASYRARWSTMEAPIRRCPSLTWSRCVLINAMSRGCFSEGAESRKSAKVARRGQPAPGKREPGSNGVFESQNVSVSRRVNAVLCMDCQGRVIVSMCVVVGGYQRGMEKSVERRHLIDGRLGRLAHLPSIKDRAELAC